MWKNANFAEIHPIWNFVYNVMEDSRRLIYSTFSPHLFKGETLVDVDFVSSTLLDSDLQCIASSFEWLGSGLVASEVSVSLASQNIFL